MQERLAPRAAQLGWEKLQGVWGEVADPQS